MLYWTPSVKTIEEWKPSYGWNASQSETEKLMETNLFFFLKNKKGFTEHNAEVYARMLVFKQKYPELKYSAEQEETLKQCLQTVFS
jgi:hypothetical protein